MDKPYYLSASINCANMLDLRSELAALEEGGIDFIHFDVMDGQFVPRLGLFPELLQQIKTAVNIPVDVHLMIEHPERYVETFAKAGAEYITVHAESTPHLHRVIRQIEELGARPGVALNPATPLEALEYVAEETELIMLMAINPGIVGHKLIPSMYGKIAKARRMFPSLQIAVDGGVTFESASRMVSEGASMLVCGTGTIFRPQEDTLQNKIRDLRKTISSNQ